MEKITYMAMASDQKSLHRTLTAKYKYVTQVASKKK